MIRSNCFLGSTIFDIFDLIHKEEEVWPDGTYPCYSQSQVVSVCQSFRPVVPFFFSGKSTICGFLSTQRVWPYGYTYDVPLVTLILSMYSFVGLTSSIDRQTICTL